MKRFLLVAVPLLLLLTSCRKEVIIVPIDEGEWIYQERGVVIESDSRCPFFVVDAESGYTVLRSADGTVPFEGSVLYGDFSNYGVRSFYNRSERFITRADVREYWLSYYDALDEMDYQCF